MPRHDDPENHPSGYPRNNPVFNAKTRQILEESKEAADKADAFLALMERMMREQDSV